MGSGLSRKAVVVGGGISGCAAAFDLRRLGFDVTLMEAKPQLGGILRDIGVDGQLYFNGCQYLRGDAPWVGALPDSAREALFSFEQRYGSYADLLGDVVCHDDFEAPVFDVDAAELSACGDPADAESLEARIRCYPPRIADAVLGWIGRLGHDPAALDAANALHIQLSRLYLRAGDAEVAALKQVNPAADALLGLPRSVRGEPHPLGSLPKAGFDTFFEVVGAAMRDAGINLRLGQPVVPDFLDGKAALKLRGTRAEPDLIVWTANPVPVLAAAGIGRLDNPFVEMTVSVGKIAGPNLPRAPHYFQIYGQQSPVTRVFVYQLGGEDRITVEHLPCGDSPEDFGDSVSALCRPFYGDVQVEISGRVQQRRHIFFTPRDRRMFEDFRTLCAATYPTFVDGAWEIYARDAKIDAIAAKVRERMTALSVGRA